MFTIHLTQKLQKEIGIKPADLVRGEDSEVPFAEWYAHVFLINRKKHVICVERQTLFSFTLPNVSRKDLRERLPELFEKGLGKALFAEGADGEVFKAVMNICRGDMHLAKTQNRPMIASTTEFIRHYKWSVEDGYSAQEADQVNRRMPMRGFPDKSRKYKLPIEVFADAAKAMFNVKFTPRKDNSRREDASQLMDKRALEKTTADLGRMLEGQDFESEEDIRTYLDNMIRSGRAPGSTPKNAVQFAQDIMYEAWEAASVKERIKLAKEALSISPDCADAYNLLAEEEAQTLKEAKDLYRKGMEAGRRALGEGLFREILEDGAEGHFWGYTSTRPYMRARVGLMECLWAMGEHDEAIGHAREMLKLNVSDNQGIRYILSAYLADLKRYDDLEEFMNGNFQEDCSAEWIYTKALLSFVRKGDTDKSSQDLKIALKANAFVPEYLMGKKSIPRDLPDMISMGGEDEGYCYAYRYLNAWRQVPGALDWLKEKSGMIKVGRNEPCPCGSGKKFTKCCGA